MKLDIDLGQMVAFLVSFVVCVALIFIVRQVRRRRGKPDSRWMLAAPPNAPGATRKTRAPLVAVIRWTPFSPEIGKTAHFRAVQNQEVTPRS
jgi:hypothetical protein